MNEDQFSKLIQRDQAMRKARDQILKRVSTWLTAHGFKRAGQGHFTKALGDRTCHIGFQKLSSGRNVRVMCHISGAESNSESVQGPWSDKFGGPDSPNGRRYNFGWSTREPDMASCTGEYCSFIKDVVFKWFEERLGKRIETEPGAAADCGA